MPQPIDIQTELVRTTLVERVADIQGRLAAAHQRAHAETIESREASETQVNQTPETEQHETEPDGRRRNPFVKRRKKKTKDELDAAATFYGADEKPTTVEDPDAHRLDITI